MLRSVYFAWNLPIISHCRCPFFSAVYSWQFCSKYCDIDYNNTWLYSSLGNQRKWLFMSWGPVGKMLRNRNFLTSKHFLRVSVTTTSCVCVCLCVCFSFFFFFSLFSFPFVNEEQTCPWWRSWAIRQHKVAPTATWATRTTCWVNLKVPSPHTRRYESDKPRYGSLSGLCLRSLFSPVNPLINAGVFPNAHAFFAARPFCIISDIVIAERAPTRRAHFHCILSSGAVITPLCNLSRLAAAPHRQRVWR